MQKGCPVVFTNAGRRFAAHVLEKPKAQGAHYRIMVSRTGETKNVEGEELEAAVLVLKKGVKKLEFATLEGLLSSVGLENRLETVMNELTDDVLDLCEALVDDFDLMLEDLASVGFSNEEQQTLTGALQHAMAKAYKSSTGSAASGVKYSAQQHVAASLVTRFIRYAAFMTKDGGSSSVLAKAVILTAKRWQDVKLHSSAERITRFIRFVVAVKRGDNVLLARTFAMDKTTGAKDTKEKRRKKSMSKSVKVRRKSMYEGDVVMKGPLSKKGTGVTKRSVHVVALNQPCLTCLLFESDGQSDILHFVVTI
jgi:hypothetical protein